jgi:transcriptional regulator with XRE-family HTH domain
MDQITLERKGRVNLSYILTGKRELLPTRASENNTVLDAKLDYIDTDREIGLRLKEVRNKLGLSQEELGEILGLRNSFISAIEREGLRNGFAKQLEKELSESVAISSEFVFQGVGAPLRGKKESNSDQESRRISARLKQIRKEMGLTQSEFGRIIGFAPNTVSEIENNTHMMSKKMRRELKKNLRIDDEFIFGGNEESKYSEKRIKGQSQKPETSSHSEVAVDFREKIKFIQAYQIDVDFSLSDVEIILLAKEEVSFYKVEQVEEQIKLMRRNMRKTISMSV